MITYNVSVYVMFCEARAKYRRTTAGASQIYAVARPEWHKVHESAAGERTLFSFVISLYFNYITQNKIFYNHTTRDRGEL